jgi:hypothetical protein
MGTEIVMNASSVSFSGGLGGPGAVGGEGGLAGIAGLAPGGNDGAYGADYSEYVSDSGSPGQPGNMHTYLIEVPEPATVALLVLGGVGVLARPRQRAN